MYIKDLVARLLGLSTATFDVIDNLAEQTKIISIPYTTARKLLDSESDQEQTVRGLRNQLRSEGLSEQQIALQFLPAMVLPQPLMDEVSRVLQQESKPDPLGDGWICCCYDEYGDAMIRNLATANCGGCGCVRPEEIEQTIYASIFPDENALTMIRRLAGNVAPGLLATSAKIQYAVAGGPTIKMVHVVSTAAKPHEVLEGALKAFDSIMEGHATIVGAEVIVTPGVKNPELAKELANRELRIGVPNADGDMWLCGCDGSMRLNHWASMHCARCSYVRAVLHGKWDDFHRTGWKCGCSSKFNTPSETRCLTCGHQRPGPPLEDSRCVPGSTISCARSGCSKLVMDPDNHTLCETHQRLI